MAQVYAPWPRACRLLPPLFTSFRRTASAIPLRRWILHISTSAHCVAESGIGIRRDGGRRLRAHSPAPLPPNRRENAPAEPAPSIGIGWERERMAAWRKRRRGFRPHGIQEVHPATPKHRPRPPATRVTSWPVRSPFRRLRNGRPTSVIGFTWRGLVVGAVRKFSWRNPNSPAGD